MVTAVVVKAGHNRGGSTLALDHAVVSENNGAGFVFRGRSVHQVILIGLTRDELIPKIADTLAAATVNNERSTGKPTVYLEV